eukprot:gene23828-8181_t
MFGGTAPAGAWEGFGLKGDWRWRGAHGDNRLMISFWGSNYNNLLGGCCSSSYGIIGGVAVVLIGMSVLLFYSCRIWKRKQQRRHVALENEVIADANAGAGVGVGVSTNNPGFVA